MFDLITVAQTFIYSALFVLDRMLLCADKQSFISFADVRSIAAGQVNSYTTFHYGGVLFGCPHSGRRDISENYA